MLSGQTPPARPNIMTRFRDLIPAYPYDEVMENTGLSREEIDETLDDIFRNLSPENKKLMKDTEFLMDMEVPE